MDNIWAIVLAAGSSTRMKQQKLLMPFNGKTMIESVLQPIISVLNKNIMVVLGSHYYEISKQIHNLPVSLSLNKNYKNGMLSSVICGFDALPEKVEAALIFLGDQPRITPEVTQKIIQAWKTNKKGIVIPTFNGKRGHPALIATKYKEQIKKLDPEKGLRQLMLSNNEDIQEVECSCSGITHDIDTPEDFVREQRKNMN